MTFPVNSIQIFIGIGTSCNFINIFGKRPLLSGSFQLKFPLHKTIAKCLWNWNVVRLTFAVIHLSACYATLRKRTWTPTVALCQITILLPKAKDKNLLFFHMPRRGLRPSFLRRPLLLLFCGEWMIISVDNLKDTDLSTYSFSLGELDKCWLEKNHAATIKPSLISSFMFFASRYIQTSHQVDPTEK